MPPFDTITLTGSPEERGIAHGEAVAGGVAANVDAYLDRFEHEGVPRGTVREQAEAFLALIDDDHPEYAAEMRGVAEGSGVPLVDVTVLNVRWEVIYTAWKEGVEADDSDPGADAFDPVADSGSASDADPPPADGCTSFGVTPPATADDRTYVGQNWDWLASIADDLLVTRVEREQRPDFLTMTEAGIVGGKIGVNEAGIGMAVNGLVSAADGEHPYRTPYHVRFREVMDAERFDEALDPLVGSPRACSANVLLGHADGVAVDLELSPEHVNHLHPSDGVLTHANHFESDAVETPAAMDGPSTLYRGRRLRDHLVAHAGEIDPDVVQDGLRDHFSAPASVCKHVDESLPEIEYGRTNASFVIDLEERRLWGTQGPPCESEYREYRLEG